MEFTALAKEQPFHRPPNEHFSFCAAYFLIYFIPRFPYSSAFVSCEDMAMVP